MSVKLKKIYVQCEKKRFLEMEASFWMESLPFQHLSCFSSAVAILLL